MVRIGLFRRSLNTAMLSLIEFDHPAPEHGRVSSLTGDCLDLLPHLTDQFDLIVTSPPYDAEKSYEGRRDFVAYREFARRWIAQIPRLLSPTGSFWLNVGYTKLGPNETLPLTYLYYDVRPPELKLVQEIVWHYEGGMSYKRRFTHRTERWMWFALDPSNVVFDLDAVRDRSLNRTSDPRNNPAGKNPTDYWYFDRVVGGKGRIADKTEHPCQFPAAMIERIIRACSPVGGHILDPFAGSGTTGHVAKKLGRHATLIEKDAWFSSMQPDDERSASSAGTTDTAAAAARAVVAS